MSVTIMRSQAPQFRVPPMVPGRPAPQHAAPVLHVAAEASVFSQGDAARCMYRVVSGLVRACAFQADGRRHIDAFYRPGDVFGFELNGVHTLCAEAVSDCTLVALRQPALQSDPQEAAQLYHYAMQALQRAQTHALLLGRCNAPQKLAHFLLDLPALGPVVELVTSRQDIADYLGLTIETISRTLSQLERDGVVKLISARRIQFLDKSRLEALTR